MPGPTLTAYATPANLQTYCDWREVGDLCVDANEEISANDQLANPIIISCLNRAAGEIETALMVSGMYSLAQLAAILAAGGNSAEVLVGTNCDGALYWIYRRKPLLFPEKLKAYKEQFYDTITKLKEGENVFNLAGNVSAGTPESFGPTIVEEARSGIMVYKPNMHYYPVPRTLFNNCGD